MPRHTLIQFLYGAQADLPSLALGEPAWCVDTFQLYVGSPEGNKLVGSGGGGGGTTSPLTSKGDLWGYGSGNARLPVGANGTVLTADSTAPLGVAWAAPSAANLPTWVVDRVCPVFDRDGLTAVVGGTGAGAAFEGWGTGGVVVTGIYAERWNTATGAVECELDPTACCGGPPAPPSCCVSPPSHIWGAATLAVPCCDGTVVYLRFQLVAVNPPPAGYSHYYELPATPPHVCDFWGYAAGGGGGGGGGGAGGSGSGSGSGGGGGGGGGSGSNYWISLFEAWTGCRVAAMTLGCLSGYDDYLFTASFATLDGTRTSTYRTAVNVSLVCGGPSFNLKLAAAIGADTPPISWHPEVPYNVELSGTEYPQYCPGSFISPWSN